MGSLFEQALVARRQTAFRFSATTSLSFAPRCFQQAAGLIYYYNSTKYYYLCVSAEEGRRQLQLLTASPENPEGNSFDILVDDLPDGMIDLRADVDGDRLTFAWAAEGDADWRVLPDIHDASILSDEVTLPRLPNFTGAFVGMACQDLSGAGTPADFASFVYREEGFSAPVD